MNLSSTIRHPVIREWMLILVTLLTLVAAVIHGGWLSRIDQTMYDRALWLLQRPAQPDIVIVGIDEESLKQIGRWPWRRSVHATLLNRLSDSGVRAVAFDIILSEPEKADPTADQVLAEAVRRNGRVILPVIADVFEGRPSGELPPVNDIARNAASLAQISLQLDDDGVLRQVPLRAGFGTARHDTFAVGIMRMLDPGKWSGDRKLAGDANPRRHAFSRDWVSDYFYTVPFAGPPGHYKTVPYIDVLRGDVGLQEIRGKVVLVGATAASLADQYPTPAGGIGAMAGIEIHANVLQGLREGINVRSASKITHGFVSAGAVTALMLAFLWLSPRQSFFATISAILLCAFIAGVMFKWLYVWWSPSSAMLALACAYPIWSWRKLEATQRFLDAELVRLEREPTIVPPESALVTTLNPMARAFVPDVIEGRIAAVQVAAQRLRSLNRLIADSLESLPESALVTNPDGRILLANSSADRLFRARRTSADPSRRRDTDTPLEGRDIVELLASFSAPEVTDWRSAWMDAYEETRAVTYEVKGPQNHEYLLQIAPLFSIRGPQTGSIVTLVDVAPLRESERARDEALRFLSHDMRSPQASILTLLEMHAEDPHSIPTDTLTMRIGRYARRTLNLADDFLRLARAERFSPADFEELDVAELMQDAVDEAWTAASAKGIRIRTEVGQTEALVKGDRDLLTRAFQNLLSNAIKYSPPDTAIECAVTASGKHWRVQVTDQGYGIAAQDLSRLFMRFSRLRTEGQPEEAGIGLGLVFVRTVAERHGGSVDVTSSTCSDAGVPRGSTFAVTLPMASAPPQAG